MVSPKKNLLINKEDKRMIFKYKDYNGKIAQCDAVRYKGNLVKVSERKGNPGASVTNCIETIATKVCKEYSINPLELVLVDCSMYEGPGKYSLVTFDGFEPKGGRLYGPKWQTIPNFEAFKEQYFNNLKYLVVPNIITFGPKDEYLTKAKIKVHPETNQYCTYTENGMCGMFFKKLGNFRYYFEKGSTGFMVGGWSSFSKSSEIFLKESSNYATEIEAIMNYLRTMLIPNYSKLEQICYNCSGDMKEVRLMGGSNTMLYNLHLIPRLGDYNLYLHVYK